jgi:hypothetical protein
MMVKAYGENVPHKPYLFYFFIIFSVFMKIFHFECCLKMLDQKKSARAVALPVADKQGRPCLLRGKNRLFFLKKQTRC